MKHYPSISKIVVNEDIYAFDKKDGTLIRAEFSFKKSHRCFTKFGTKKCLIDENTEIYGEAVNLIRETTDDLSKICEKNRYQNVTCYFEFYGQNSFAGLHQEEPHRVMLFDASIDKRGLLEPREFIKIFTDHPSSELFTQICLYSGKANRPFVESVQSRSLEDMTFEGVVCKGKYVSPGLPLMFKIKSNAWIELVKSRYTDPKILEDLL